MLQSDLYCFLVLSSSNLFPIRLPFLTLARAQRIRHFKESYTRPHYIGMRYEWVTFNTYSCIENRPPVFVSESGIRMVGLDLPSGLKFNSITWPGPFVWRWDTWKILPRLLLYEAWISLTLAGPGVNFRPAWNAVHTSINDFISVWLWTHDQESCTTIYLTGDI